MIHFTLVVIIVNAGQGAAPPVDKDKPLRDIVEREEAIFRGQVETLRENTVSITCDRCGRTFWGYPTPGRARMAMSGHSKWCRAHNP